MGHERTGKNFDGKCNASFRRALSAVNRTDNNPGKIMKSTKNSTTQSRPLRSQLAVGILAGEVPHGALELTEVPDRITLVTVSRFGDCALVQVESA